jgi:hypothetical protein
VRVSDFVFGRTIGLVSYATASVCVFLASIWMWRERLVNRTLMFAVLLLVVVACTPPESWGIYGFVNDLSLVLAAIVFFAAPLARPRTTLIAIFTASALFAAPLLINPLGAWNSRLYYLQTAPYRLLPAELSLVEKYGLTAEPPFQHNIPNGRLYFLNDYFYSEEDFFWVHGQSTLEFLMAPENPANLPALQIINGSEVNDVTLQLGTASRKFHLQPAQTINLDLSTLGLRFKPYQGRHFLHGTIHTSSGFVPKLLSRENPDYRYLGCQVRFAARQ